MDNKRSQQRMGDPIPKEIDEWNWGAFFLNGIWGVANRTYIALLAFIPFVNIIVMPILGLKGNKMAWNNKEWESVDHFKSVQRNWNIAGMGICAVYIIVVLAEFLMILF